MFRGSPLWLGQWTSAPIEVAEPDASFEARWQTRQFEAKWPEPSFVAKWIEARRIRGTGD